ncbi:MAG: glycosyltransferase family 9 protein [Ignavibacteriaceae bacterium]|nr:glycosyltransferase family 9 protein [Ignavibacteriaceae bacterium]
MSAHKLGDGVFTLPALKILMSQPDHSSPTIITYSENQTIYKRVFDNTNYVIIKRSDFLFSGRVLRPTLWLKFFLLKAEYFFDFSGGIHSALIALLSPARVKIGINQQLYRNVFDKPIDIRERPHISDIYLDICRVYLNESPDDGVKVHPLTIHKIEKILIAPKGGWRAKEWGINRFLQTAGELKKCYQIHFVFEKGTLPEDFKTALFEGGFSYTETEDIDSLMKCIEDYDLFFSNDTGPLYIANFMGKATFAIYGPTNPEFHLPDGSGHGFSVKKLSCSPVHEKFCHEIGGRSCYHFSCMNELSVKDVTKDIITFISRFNQESPAA